MNTPISQGEVRPSDTADTRPSAFSPPHYRLRSRDPQTITPETCLVRHCPICQWRREGLLDEPVVRETPRYNACPDCAYALGLEHGAADGPQSRPSLDWLAEAGLDASAYLRGYDEGCRHRLAPLWNEALAALDGLPL